MKPKPSHQDQKLIELLKSLGTLRAEYPQELLTARREAFIAQIEKHNASAGVNEVGSPSPEQVIELLEALTPAIAEYPPELLAARRAAFLAQIEEHNRSAVPQEMPSQEKVLELLGNLKPATAEYPADLLAARRAAFVAQIQQHNSTVSQEELLSSPAHNGSIFKLFKHLKSIEIEYPLKLWSARRSVFVNQIRDGKVSVLDALRAAVYNLFSRKQKPTASPTISFQRMSLVFVALLLVVVIGSQLYGIPQPLTNVAQPSASQAAHESPVVAVTGTQEVAKIVCEPGLKPPLCLPKEFDKTRNLTYSGNGSARPAVAKDTMPGYSRDATSVNDGMYGAEASWISNSAYSWIKIDLGEVRTINTVMFGRDRLGQLNDGDPGQFIVAVALSDDVYADGNSRNDSEEYTQVYNSDQAGFDGLVTGAETVKATFAPVEARYIKITFENARTAVDEIEVFMIQPPAFTSVYTQRPRDTLVPSTFTPIPTHTLIPSKTATLIPTNTLIPTLTATLRPTLTPRPTNTDVPTDTPEPPTDTPEPPTDTPRPPTDTPEPPTDTPRPPPTDTPEPPPTDTEPAPQLVSTETPEVLAP